MVTGLLADPYCVQLIYASGVGASGYSGVGDITCMQPIIYSLGTHQNLLVGWAVMGSVPSTKAPLLRSWLYCYFRYIIHYTQQYAIDVLPNQYTQCLPPDEEVPRPPLSCHLVLPLVVSHSSPAMMEPADVLTRIP